MRLPRFRIWILMLAVALTALWSSWLALSEHHREYCESADGFARTAEHWHRLVPTEEQRIESARRELNLVERGGRVPDSALARLSLSEDLPSDQLLKSLRLDMEDKRDTLAHIRIIAAYYDSMAAAYRRAAWFPVLGPPNLPPAPDFPPSVQQYIIHQRPSL
jgi:hypothetical protein